MTINIEAGSSALDASAKHRQSIEFWDKVEFRVNDEVVSLHDPFVLPAGKENVVTIKVPDLAQLRLGFVGSGNIRLSANPEFGSPIPLVNGIFRCTITPDADQSGRDLIVFYSADVPLPLEVVIEVRSLSSVLFTFQDNSGQPLPVPPNIFELPAGATIKTMVAYLRNTEDEPLANVSGTFYHADRPPRAFKAGSSGRLHLAVQNYNYPEGHLFTVRAVAEFLEGDKVAELHVKVL